MPKKNKPTSRTSKSAQTVWPPRRVVVALGGIGGIIVITLALIEILQAERDSIKQDNTDATKIAIQIEQANADSTETALQEEELLLLRGMATAYAQITTDDTNAAANATALAQQFMQVEATLQALGQLRSDTPTPVVAIAPSLLDVVLVFDTSASMQRNPHVREIQSTASKIISELKSANENNRVGIVTFGLDAQVLQPITNNFAMAELATENVYQSYQEGTTLFSGLDTAYEMLKQSKRDNSSQAIILFTDGANYSPATDRNELDEITYQTAHIIQADEIRIASVLLLEDSIWGSETYLSRIVSGKELLITEPLQLDIESFVQMLTK